MFNLPGNKYKPDHDSFCDSEGHEGIVAVCKIQGETDSFGAEYMHMCQACYDEHKDAPDPMTNGDCEWCKKESNNLKPTRDYDEGSNGPVYYVCQHCRFKQNQEALEELNYMRQREEEEDNRY